MLSREYRERQQELIYRHGRYGTVYCYPVYKKASYRCRKYRPTSDIQKKLNDVNAQDKFARLIDNNFEQTDREFQLTYKACAPDTYKQCLSDIQKWLRKVRRYFQKEFGTKLKYVGVIEKGVKRGRFHAHIVINIPDPTRRTEIEDRLDDLWIFGTAQPFKLAWNEEGMSGMSKYLIANPDKPEVPGKVKKWICSKGLKKPRSSVRTGKISSRLAREVINGNITERELEKFYPGYTVVSIEPYGEYQVTEAEDGTEVRETDYRRSYFKLRLYKKE